ncbi:MAG: hypothetical protein V1755_08365 [Chloroflexota bacterium]
MGAEKHISQCKAALDGILANVVGITDACKLLAVQLAAERDLLEAEGQPQPVEERHVTGLPR